MIRKCSECKGKGYKVKSYKICEACHGTGFQSTEDISKHVKGLPETAKQKFHLEDMQEVPCPVCKGKGEIEVREKCSACDGKGEINICPKCGKIIEGTSKYCPDCQKKDKVYILHPACTIEDLERDKIYKGKITRIEDYGVFVSLNNKVWGLMRGLFPDYKIGDEVLVKVAQINHYKGEVDLLPASISGSYEVVKLKKDIPRTRIGKIDNKSLGKTIRIVGEVIQIQQTTGPTIFTISDETGTTSVAAFDEPGIRAYPHIQVGHIVEVIGEVNQHSGRIQIESEIIERLIGKEASEARRLIDEAIDRRAEPEKIDLLIESEILERLRPRMIEAAKAIRRAIFDGRSILVRHHADADGICAGVAIEKAVIPLLRELNPNIEAEWHYFKRKPSKAPFYELEDVVKDLTYALEDMERFGQKLPLIVLLDNGSTEEDILALLKAKIYDIEIVVIDHHYPGEVVDGRVEVDDYVDVHVNPYLVGGDSQLTAGALSVEIAKMINPEIEERILHLPGIAVVGDHADSPEAEKYIELAKSKGYTREDLEKIAACIDFEAFYLRFMNGRGIIDTILGLGSLDKHKKLVEALYKEYEKRVKSQLRAALPHVKSKKLPNGILLNVLDVEKYSHRFTFPAPGKTCGFVHDYMVQKHGEDKPIITLAYGPDFSVIRATDAVHENFGFNLNKIVWELADEIPEAAIDGGGHECAGSLKYVEGLSKKVLGRFAEKIAKLERK
ncbi:MAG: DHH family phosphoesterase [Methanobacteriales archaeon]|nr:DHH family phosphoesterase [Methanobacteriales archaeon]MBC7117501.1 DHH family phosphoesterase [Methanobacteriaceae archaeon]